MSGAAAGRVNRWWDQYEETAQRLDAKGDFRAADDIRTLVDGLRELEREKVAAAALQAELDTAKEALAAYRSALRSGEPETEQLRALGESVLSAADPPREASEE